MNRSSILCPNCRRLINVDESHCPYCNIRRPGAWWKNNALTLLFQQPDKLIRSILYINVGMFVLSLIIGSRSMIMSMNPLTAFSPGQTSLALLGATGTYPINELGRWWTLVAANYLHGGVLHILFNMVALRQLAPLVVQAYGPHRMFVLYTLSGVLGFVVSYAAGIPFTIGASAAICGMIGASLYYGKSRGGVYGGMLYRQIGGWAIGIFLFGLLVPGINNWGHGGGLAAGALLGLLLGYEERQRELFVHKVLAWICLAATLLILAWAVGTSLLYRFLS